MSKQTTVLLQNGIIALMQSLKSMQRECKDIYDAYWKTDATTLITALSTGTTPATKLSKLTKQNYLDGVTYAEELNDFFQNGSVNTADFNASLQKIIYGNAVLSDQLSEATESIGDRIKQLALDAIQVYKDSQNLVELYFDNELGDIVGALDSQRIVPGCEATASDVTLAIVLFQQYQNMIENSAVTQGDYSATVAIWERHENL